MKHFLLLFLLAVVSCSKSHFVSEGAPIGTWKTDCLSLSKSELNAALSFKGVLRTHGSNSGATVTKFSDGACSKPYATISFEINGPTSEKTASNNFFILRSSLTKVSFVAHTPEALSDLSKDTRNGGTAIEASALVVEKTIDVTNKLPTYEAGSLKMEFLFQFMKNNGEDYDENLAQIFVIRPINEKMSQIVLDFSRASKISKE